MLKFALALMLASSAHAVTVISDVDDTLKITNSGSGVDAAWNGVFNDKVFAGMPQLYHGWMNAGHTLHFVTGSPSIIRGKVRSLLRKNKIKYETLVTRASLTQSTYRFKMNAISRIMDAAPTEQVVLIGDDVSQDHNVFRDIAAKYPERVLASYVRPVKNRPGLEGQIPYVTAFDVLSVESAAGRMAEVDADLVTEAVLQARAKLLLPGFAWCPTELDGTLLPTDTSASRSAEEVETLVETICRERQSDS